MIPILIAGMAMSAAAQTTINMANKYSYAANFGWMDWRGDGTNGVVVSAYVCSGSIYSANVGWINLGTGVPANGIQYQNNSATDYGVNLSNTGKLRGFAYGANIGWLNFENLGDPHINMLNGKFGGSVFSANCGWISLSTLFSYVQTDMIQPGVDTDGDGLPDAWELTHYGSLAGGPGADTDGDGQTSLEEYLAGTNPNDPSSVLAITSHNSTAGTSTTLTWKSVMNRNYRIQQSTDLNSWIDSGLGIIAPAGATTTDAFTHPYAPKRFFRVLAVNPLAP
jgi:hypothetical protein